jgi:hypothetical protein
MKTEKELNSDITGIIKSIEEKFPELINYLKEMPVKISDTAGTEINIKSLKDYFDSLADLKKNYTKYCSGILNQDILFETSSTIN